MPIPAGNFGNPNAQDEDTWATGLPLLIGIAGLAVMYFLGKARGRASVRTQGLRGLGHGGCGPGCGCSPCQQPQRRWG